MTALASSSLNIESRDATFQSSQSSEQQIEATLIATGVAVGNPPMMQLA